MDKEHEFEEQNILQEFLFYLHSPGIAECGDAERQSCGQYDAGRIQRDFSGRRCGGEPDTIRLSAVPAGLRRRACNLLQPVLGQEADRSDEEDCRDGYACRTFDCHCAVCPGQPVFPAGGWNLYDGRPDHWGRGKVSSDYPFYLPVLCGDPAPSGGIKKRRDRQDRVPALHPYIFYKLRH